MAEENRLTVKRRVEILDRRIKIFLASTGSPTRTQRRHTAMANSLEKLTEIKISRSEIPGTVACLRRISRAYQNADISRAVSDVANFIGKRIRMRRLA